MKPHGAPRSRGALLLAMTTALACGKASGPLPLCLAETVEPGGSGSLAAEIWFASLLPDYQRETRRVTAPARDCTGAPITWPSNAACPLAGAAAAAPDRPLGPNDLVVQPLDDQHTLVWLITRRYLDGDGLGPAALVEWTDRGFAVRALGPLRAPTQQAQLRLEAIGEERLLVVDADRCETASACRPVTVLVPLLAGRFTPRPLLGADGRCDGPPELDRARAASTTHAATTRSYTLNAALRFEAGQLFVDEQVSVTDVENGRSDVPPRPFRSAGQTRRISLEAGLLRSDRPALWPSVLARDARVDGDPAAPL